MRRAGSTSGNHTGESCGRVDPACGDSEFDADELCEFLAADRVEVDVDPVFKERLRRRLWGMIRLRLGGGRPA